MKSKKNAKLKTQQDHDKQTSLDPPWIWLLDFLSLRFLFKKVFLVYYSYFNFHVLIFRSLLNERLNVFMKLQSPFYRSDALVTVFRVFHEVMLPGIRS